MKSVARVGALILLHFAALAAAADADQKPKNADSPIHLIPCSIEKVNQCLAPGICFGLRSDSYSDDRHGSGAKHREPWIWAHE